MRLDLLQKASKLSINEIIPSDIFDPAFEEVVRLMDTNVWPAFTQSTKCALASKLLQVPTADTE
jgi:hypothetical protein